MKKFFAALCALMLCLSGFSFAETVDAAEFPESPLRSFPLFQLIV